MSQPADWGVPSVGPVTPTDYASRDNGAFDALLSGHIGASRPAYALQGTFWLKDTGSSPLVIEEYFFDGTNDILIAYHDVATGKSSFTNFVGSAIASAATIVIPIDGNYFSLTGTTTVSTMTVAANHQFTLKSASGLTLTAGAPIVTIDGNDLVLDAGQTVTLQSTAADTVQVVSVGSVGGGVGAFGSAFLHIQDQKAAATDGGTFTSGARRTRVLNTVLTNQISGASLASDQITLAAGDYMAIISTPCYKVDANQAWLYDTTGAADLLVGSSENTSSGNAVTARNAINGRFTLGVESVLEVQHQCQTTFATSGFGQVVGGFTTNSLYTDVMIWKVG